jgi:dipeptidyl aminopeptidase/acylaminoacyl peptidase
MTHGKDESGGPLPSQARKDLARPAHWRMEAVAAVSRPHHLRLSPAGDRVAFILDRADLGSDVWLMGIDGSDPHQLTVDRPPAAFWEDTAPAWSPGGDLVAYEADGWVQVVPAEGGPGRRLVEAGSPVFVDQGRLVVSFEVDRHRTGTTLPTVTEVTRLGMVELADPWVRPLTSAHADASDPDFSGERMALVVYPPNDRNRSDVVVADLRDRTGETVRGTPEMHAHSPRWSHDGGKLAFVSEEPGWNAVFIHHADDVSQLTDGEGDHADMRWSPDDSRLLSTRTLRGRTDLVVTDASSGETEVLAEGGTWSDPAWLPDGSVMAVFESHSVPARIERIGPDGTRRVVFDTAPSPVRTAPYAPLTEITYNSGDGLEIHGFLMRPADTGRPVPAIVYPHGGPTSHYGDEWDGYAQYFVDKGYAWLAINFRGSTSYGRDFERANHGVWGVADTADCLAAYDYLAGLEWVDPDRIGIFGASYGSYMALASLTDDPDYRFACGVAKYGDCDILSSWAQGDRVGTEDLERMMGHPAGAPAAYRAGSPIHRLENIARPLLIAHGEKDARVHPRQSEQLVGELKRLGKTYEYLTYPTEGHGFLRREPQLDFYRRLERFLDWYLM